MVTVDHFLVNLINDNSISIEDVFPKKDIRVLKSLVSIVTGPSFITENQSKLLLRILRENQEKIPNFSEDIKTLLAKPKWSKHFRQLDIVKKIYTSSNFNQDPVLTIELTFSAGIRKVLHENSKKISNLVQVTPGKIYTADLTEKNIVRVIELLKPYNFEIDEKLVNFYDTIKSWSKNEVENQFLPEAIEHTNFQNKIFSDIGNISEADENVILDRSVRYQFFHKNSGKNPENLTEIIALRKNTKIWINRKDYSLGDVIKSLIDLKRLPVLVVFDSFNDKKSSEDLENLSENLEKNGIFENVGIYFRLDNDESGSVFNNFVKEKKYNCQLDTTTKIVGVQGGKIPKFLLKNDWAPMSVISLGNNLRNSKTSVYASRCDLVISYSDTEPMIESRQVWE